MGGQEELTSNQERDREEGGELTFETMDAKRLSDNGGPRA
jgi:hypothetical protein